MHCSCRRWTSYSPHTPQKWTEELFWESIKRSRSPLLNSTEKIFHRMRRAGARKHWEERFLLSGDPMRLEEKSPHLKWKRKVKSPLKSINQFVMSDPCAQICNVKSSEFSMPIEWYWLSTVKPMSCEVVLCDVMWGEVVSCDVMWCDAVQCDKIRFDAVWSDVSLLTMIASSYLN